MAVASTRGLNLERQGQSQPALPKRPAAAAVTPAAWGPAFQKCGAQPVITRTSQHAAALQQQMLQATKATRRKPAQHTKLLLQPQRSLPSMQPQPTDVHSSSCRLAAATAQGSRRKRRQHPLPGRLSLLQGVQQLAACGAQGVQP
jgi:hypothetical protein